MAVFIISGSEAGKPTEPASTTLYDQPVAEGTARLVVTGRHIKRPASGVFGYGGVTAAGTCELDEVRVEIQQPDCEPVLVSAFTVANATAGGRAEKQPPTVLGALVSHGRITLAMAGWNSVTILEANLVGEDPAAKWRTLSAPWTPASGIYWIDDAQAEVKLKLGPDGHLVVGVRDKSQPQQPQSFSWYEEEAGTWALGFKAVGPQ